MFKKKHKIKKQTRHIDGLRLFRKETKTKKKKSWFWLFVFVPILISFIFVGKLSASYVLPNLNLLTLIRDGKFLVLFQNNSELRSSGGFIGSFAVVEVKNFEVKNITFNTNIYALDNAYTQSNQIKPPSGIVEMLNSQTWSLRDANYDASFPEAAKDINYFYEQETGDKIDGIIGINAKLIVDLLKLTGPIKLDKSNVTLTADNFYAETQSQIEQVYYQNPENWVLNEPKTFLKDMYPELLRSALKEKIQLISTIKKNLMSKEIIFYFDDPAKELLAQKYNLAGAIPTNQELKNSFSTNDNIDYLYINSNSYSGNKSSISIKEDVDYKLTETEENGQKMYKADLKISRIHGGSYDWPDGKNLEWLRVYVPQNAQFIEAKINEKDISSDIEINTEFEKNYFGVKITTEPGQANIIELSYLIPYEQNYHLLIQKQPGRTEDSMTVNVDGKMLYDGILDRDIKI